MDGEAQNNMQFEWTGGGYAYKNSDYARLLKSIYEGEAFDMEALEEEFFDYADAEEIGGMYGLGVIKYEFPGLGTFIGHSGFFPIQYRRILSSGYKTGLHDADQFYGSSTATTIL